MEFRRTAAPPLQTLIVITSGHEQYLPTALPFRDGIEPGPNPKARRLASVFRGSHRPAARTLARKPKFSPKKHIFPQILILDLFFMARIFFIKTEFIFDGSRLTTEKFRKSAKSSKKLANVLARPDPQLALSNPTRPELASPKPDPTRDRKNQARSHPYSLYD